MNKHQCTIIIDTNQFYSDMMLSGLRWKKLIEYIEKTDACIQMPQIVWDEIHRNHKKITKNHYHTALSAIEKLNTFLNFSEPSLDFFGEKYKITETRSKSPGLTDKITQAYLAHIKKSLQLKAKDFIKTDTLWFDEIVRRAINHKKPFSEDSDKGFKDTILWKSILSLKQRPGFKDYPLAFISSNNKDFGNPQERGKLHESLAEEAKAAGLDLNYFENLDVFLQNWANDVISTDFKSIRKIISENMIKAALELPLKKIMQENETVRNNLFFTGTNFKIEATTPGKKTIRTSVSGYLTNTKTGQTYLDFNSELIYQEEKKEHQLTVDKISTPGAELINLISPKTANSAGNYSLLLELYGNHKN